MSNKSPTTSSIDHYESSIIKYQTQLNPSADEDPWCLFCRTNLKTEHIPYKYIFDERQPLDGLIESRLGLELDTTLPSAYLCHKCERELQRMSWRDATARKDVQAKLESNLHLWPPHSSLPAPGERGTVSTNAASDHQRLFNQDASSSSSFQNLQSGARVDSATMASSRGFRDAREVQFQAGEIKEEPHDNEEDDVEEEEDDDEEEITGDTTTYILYSTPSGTLETRLVSHETLRSPSRKRKGNKKRTRSRYSVGDSEKNSGSESTSFSQDSTFGDVLSLSVPDRLNKTDRISSIISSSYNASRDLTVLEPQSLEMKIPEDGETRSSTATTTRLRYEHLEEGGRLAEDDDSRGESDEDAITTTTTTTTTTTMTTPKGTTQWTKTKIKTIWDDVDEEEETEEVAVEVATPTTTLPSSTEAAVAAASAATKKAFSHSPDTRRRKRENRQSSKEKNDEEGDGVEKKAKTDRFESEFLQEDDPCRSPGVVDMDTTTRTTQYYEQSRMDSGRPRSLQLAGDHLGNVCLYRGNYGDVGQDYGERDRRMDSMTSAGIDMKYRSPDQGWQYLHDKPGSGTVEWPEKEDGRLEYYNKNMEDMRHSKIEDEDYYMRNKEEQEKDKKQEEEEKEKESGVNYREKGEHREIEEERMMETKVEKRESYASQFYPQGIDVCQEFPFSSPDQQTGNYRSDVGVEGDVRVDGGYRLDENRTATIINSSLGYQSTEFNSDYPPDSYPSEQSENAKEHWSSSSTTDRNIDVDRGQMPKAGVTTTTYDRWTDDGSLANTYPKDRDQTRSGLERVTDLRDDSCEEMNSAEEGSSWDGAGSSKNHGGGQKGGGGDEASGSGSPSNLRRQGSKESRSGGRHRKRRHKGRKRDRSKDSVNSNDSSSGSSNPVMQPHEETGGDEEEREVGLAHREKGQVNPTTSVEEGDVVTAMAACSGRMEEEEVEEVGKGGGVPPAVEWQEKVEESNAGATTPGHHLWTTVAGDTIDERGGSTASPEIYHSPTTELAYKHYPDDYSQRYYDDGGGGGVGDGGGGGGGGGYEETGNNNNNDNFEGEEKNLDEDNNNNNTNNGFNNSNDEFCSVDREATRLNEETLVAASFTGDSWGANPASCNLIDNYQQYEGPEDKNTDRNYGQVPGSEQSPSIPNNKSLEDPSSPPLGGDYSSPDTVDKTQPDADYISPTSHSLEESCPTIKLVSPTMDYQDTKTDSDTNAIYTDNIGTNTDMNADTIRMDTDYDLNNTSTVEENSNMDNNQFDCSDNLDDNVVGHSDNVDANRVPQFDNIDSYKEEYSMNIYDDQIQRSGRSDTNEVEQSSNMDANQNQYSYMEQSDNIDANNMDLNQVQYSENTDSNPVEYSYIVDSSQGQYSDNMDGNTVESSYNIDSSQGQYSDNTDGAPVEYSYNIDSSQGQYSDNTDGAPVESSYNIDSSQEQYSDNTDGNPVEYSYTMDSSKDHYCDNMDGDPVEYSYNIDSNQGQYSENTDGNPVEYSYTIDSSQGQYADNTDDNRVEYLDSMDSNKVEYSYNVDSNQGQYSENADVGPVEILDNTNSNQVEFSYNIDSNQPESGGYLNADATITAETSDSQWREPNLGTDNLNEDSEIRDDYESYHKEFGYTGETDSVDNRDFVSNYNAYETSNPMDQSPMKAEDVADFEKAPSIGEWAGYKDGGYGDEQTKSFNKEINQGEQTMNWNESLGKENYEDGYVAKIDTWGPMGSDAQKEERDAEDDGNRNYSNDYNVTFDTDNAYGQEDGEKYNGEYNQTYTDDSIVNTEFEVEEAKESYNKEYEMSESKLNDYSANDAYTRQDTYPRYGDSTPVETKYIVEAGESQDYGDKTGEYSGDTNATYNIEESGYSVTDSGVDKGDYIDERLVDPLDKDTDEQLEKNSDFKIEEVDLKENGTEYDMKESPVDRGTSHAQEVRVDDEEEDACFGVDNMAAFGNQDWNFSQQEDEKEAGIERDTPEELSWQSTSSAPADCSARRPADLHLTSTIYNENTLTVGQEFDNGNTLTVKQEPDYEKQSPVESSNVEYSVSSPVQEIQSSPYSSPSEKKDEKQEEVVESLAEQNIYLMNETTGDGTGQESETPEQFQGDIIIPHNVTSVCYAAVISPRGTEVEEEVLMVQTDETEEISIVPEIRTRIINGRQPFDDSRYSSMYDEDMITSLDGSSSIGPAWSSFSAQYEVDGVVEARLEAVEEAVIVPSVRGDVNDSYRYGYGLMTMDAVGEGGAVLDTEGELRPLPMGVCDEPGGSSFPDGSSECNQAGLPNNSGEFADTSEGGSFLDVAGDTEQKRWACFESSENKAPSAIGVLPQIERLRYGVRVRSGHAAASVGRKTDDQKPLIEGDGKEFDDRDGDSGFWTPDTENDENTDTMPFGFGKKKSAPVIDKKPEPPVAEPPQKVEPVEQVPVKKEEVVKSAEDADAGDNTSQQAIVSMKETTSAPEETNTEMVPSDAVDGGADQQLGNEPVEQKIEDQIEIQEKTVENASKSPDETVEKAEKEETVKAEVPTAKEPEVIEQDVVDCEKELVAATDHVADLAVTQEVMSVDLNELEDDFEVVILDRFELLGKPVVEQMPVDSIAEKTAVEPPIPVVEKQTKKQPRVESTPLIGKQTKVKDTQPGFLCCTII